LTRTCEAYDLPPLCTITYLYECSDLESDNETSSTWSCQKHGPPFWQL